MKKYFQKARNTESYQRITIRAEEMVLEKVNLKFPNFSYFVFVDVIQKNEFRKISMELKERGNVTRKEKFT